MLYIYSKPHRGKAKVWWAGDEEDFIDKCYQSWAGEGYSYMNYEPMEEDMFPEEYQETIDKISKSGELIIETCEAGILEYWPESEAPSAFEFWKHVDSHDVHIYKVFDNLKDAKSFSGLFDEY